MAQRAKRIAEENSHHDCDFRDMLSRVGDKWSLLVIFILKGRPAFRGRFSDLKRSIPGISQRMLTATVRNLERDGMLTRHVYAEVPPRVEYRAHTAWQRADRTGARPGLLASVELVAYPERARSIRCAEKSGRPARCLCINPRLTTASPPPRAKESRIHLPAPPPLGGSVSRPVSLEPQLRRSRDNASQRVRIASPDGHPHQGRGTRPIVNDRADFANGQAFNAAFAERIVSFRSERLKENAMSETNLDQDVILPQLRVWHVANPHPVGASVTIEDECLH